jgi:ribosomal protein S18 acetylase RimI-like enzyme
MSLAVAPDAAGHGIGQLLVKHFLTVMKQRNVTTVSLTTDKDANERVNRFYQGLGFQIARAYTTREGRCMNEYVIDLTSWHHPLEEINE